MKRNSISFAGRARGVRLPVLAVALVLALALALLLAPAAYPAQADTPEQGAPLPAEPQPVALYFFWGDGCPHCETAKPWLAALSRHYPTLEVRDYEVWYNEANQVHMQNMAAAYGFEPSGVPTFFVGDRYWIGFAEPMAAEMQAAVATCVATGCRDAGLGVIPGIPTPTAVPAAAAAAGEDVRAPGLPGAAPAQTVTTQSGARQLAMPFFGTVDLSGHSLVLSTALIAFVDGFNPCSLWVLSVLLALTLHTGSRRKVFIVGLVFVTVTAFIYALFIAGLFTMFTVISFTGWIQVIVALVALTFAVVNIKDYFWYKQGISFTISEGKKPGIYRRMRAVLDAGDSTWALIGATVVLAAGVSLVEFSCTAGFPVLWTNLLIAQEATAATFLALLLLYMLIYQLDELAIFGVAVISLKASRLEEKHGRLLKLIGGMLMLTLAAVMLINPALMNNLSSSLLVFVVAFAATGLLLLLHRVILPRFGVYIGSELAAPRKQKHR